MGYKGEKGIRGIRYKGNMGNEAFYDYSIDPNTPYFLITLIPLFLFINILKIATKRIY